MAKKSSWRSSSLTGVIHDDVRFWISRGGQGNPTASFHLQLTQGDTKGIIKCLATEALAERVKNTCEKGAQIYVKGRYADDDGGNLFIEAFALDGKPLERSKRAAEQAREYDILRGESVERLIETGHVNARVYGGRCRWLKATECVEITSGVWWHKSSFIAEMLGPKRLTAELKIAIAAARHDGKNVLEACNAVTDDLLAEALDAHAANNKAEDDN